MPKTKKKAFQNTTKTTKKVLPGSKPYGPMGGALKLFYAKDDEVLMDGPAGTGKSRAILEKIHAMLLKYEGARGLIVRKTRKSMTESVLVTFEEKVLPTASPIRTGPSRPMRHSYKYPNGSELVVGGMDASDKIMSTEYDVIGVFEATELSEEDWEKLTTRLRNGMIPYQQLLGDCNPAGPAHWLNQRCIKRQTRRIKSRHEDNPTVTPKYLDKLRNLTGVRRARLYLGKWQAQEGLVYEEFNESIHVIDEMPKGWFNWTKIRAIDFGFINPFVCQWWALSPDGDMYMYREIYRSKRLVEDHAHHIVQLSLTDGHISATVADHDAEDRATLEKHGVRTVRAYKSITRGIQAVQARLRLNGRKKPRIYFLRDSLVERDPELADAKLPTSTLEEFGEYIWPKGNDGKPLKEVPVDMNNHGMDPLRYAVARVDISRQLSESWQTGHSYETI